MCPLLQSSPEMNQMNTNWGTFCKWPDQQPSKLKVIKDKESMRTSYIQEKPNMTWWLHGIWNPGKKKDIRWRNHISLGPCDHKMMLIDSAMKAQQILQDSQTQIPEVVKDKHIGNALFLQQHWSSTILKFVTKRQQGQQKQHNNGTNKSLTWIYLRWSKITTSMRWHRQEEFKDRALGTSISRCVEEEQPQKRLRRKRLLGILRTRNPDPVLGWSH